MSEHPRGIVPIDWPALVREAIRRRKAEKMTQRDHAALAGVSVPTIVAFDRAETTLSLAKAFDILRVVGLLENKDRAGSQQEFVVDAFERWRQLTANLPPVSQARFPFGFCRIDYELKGPLKNVTLPILQEALKQSVVPYTGWPLFLFLTHQSLTPYEQDEAIQCWVKPEDAGDIRAFDNAAHCDFWRVSREGRAMTIRGYQEDSEETFPPGTILDTTLPIWRLAEALLHASRLAHHLSEDPHVTQVRLRALYTGLKGRLLKSWANPLSDLFIEGGASRSDEAQLEITANTVDIEAELPRLVHSMVASLYERFGVSGLTLERVKTETARMLNSRTRGGP
jgi:transcriptional regulator with XRE-family HTH domain